MSLGSFLLTRLDIESSLIWIDEVDKLFDMPYILMENHVKFVAYKLKEEHRHGGINCKTSVCNKANHP